MCALDFVRKMNEHSQIRRWLFRLVIGRYAWREYRLLEVNLIKSGWRTDFRYSCEGTDYNQRTDAEFEAMNKKYLEGKL